MADTYRAAVVGCGGMGRRHASVYAGLPKANVVAAADMHQGSLDIFPERTGVTNTYLNYREMLEREKPDLVSVTTWENSHCEIVVAAAESGAKGIMCEKPMAMNLYEADEMIAACDRMGTILAIGHMRRYNQFYLKAKQLIDAGQLGEVQRMHAYCRGWDLFLWGTHYADMLYFLNDDQPVEWVFGQISWKQHNMAYPESESLRRRRGDLYIAEDDAIGYMRFPNGVRAMLESGIHSPKDWAPRGNLGGKCELTIQGTQGLAIVSDVSLSYCTLESGRWFHSDPLTEEERAKHSHLQFEAELQELIGCVETGKEHQLNGRRGRAALEMLLAIYESSRSREVVELPLKARDNPFLAMVQSGELP